MFDLETFGPDFYVKKYVHSNEINLWFLLLRHFLGKALQYPSYIGAM